MCQYISDLTVKEKKNINFVDLGETGWDGQMDGSEVSQRRMDVFCVDIGLFENKGCREEAGCA